MEEFNKPFHQSTINLREKKSTDVIEVSKLLTLVENHENYNELIKEFKIEIDKKSYINISKIDVAFKYVEFITKKYQYLKYNNSDKNISTFLKSDVDKLKSGIYFKIENAWDEDGSILDDFEAKAEYDSVNMFYKSRELTKYINFLKSKNKQTLLDDINTSWDKEFERDPQLSKNRKFRFLKDKNGKFYLRSITSGLYKEYGVAFAFVISILNLNRAMKNHKGLNFYITSLSLNESKFEMIITSGNPVKMGSLGFVSASLSIRNNDLGNQSLSFTNTIKFTPIQKSEIDIYLYPKRKVKDVTENKKVSHTLKIETVFDEFRDIDNNFYSPEAFIRDYEGFYKAKSADELRQKINEKIEANNSPFKEVRQLKDLFKRSTNVKVDNIATLLVLCGKAELLDMDYDLKFKLRYIISDILLYGRTGTIDNE